MRRPRRIQPLLVRGAPRRVGVRRPLAHLQSPFGTRSTSADRREVHDRELGGPPLSSMCKLGARAAPPHTMCADPETVAPGKCRRGGPFVQHESGARLFIDDINEAQCRVVLGYPRGNGRCYSCMRLPMHSTFYKTGEIHELTLSSPHIQSLSRSGIIDFVRRCRTLVSITLCVSAGTAAQPEEYAQLAQAVGASNLRELRLGDISAAGACAFFDTLPASRIHHLCVNALQMSLAEEAAVLASVVRFVTDPVRSRSVRSLHVYYLSLEATCVLAHVILGSRDALAPGAPEADAQAPNLSIKSVYGGYSTHSNAAIEVPAWIAHSRYSTNYTAFRAVSERNRSVCQRTRQEACTLLRAARIVGCRVHFLGDCPGIFPFVLLPEEIRLRVLAQLAPYLDRTQFISVCSWACCAATIGHCCRPRPDPRPPMEPVLPVPPWNWEACTFPAHTMFFKGDCDLPHHLRRRCMHLRFALPFLESTGTNYPPLHG